MPVSFPANPELEWCLPGHGDLFSTIWESGLLDALEAQGFKYLFISNSDNLGARPPVRLRSISRIRAHCSRSRSPNAPQPIVRAATSCETRPRAV